MAKLEEVLGIESIIEEIDEKIKFVEAKMRPYEQLNQKKQELLAARRALLGGSRLTGGTSTRVRQEDVVAFVRENPGKTPQVLADHFGATYQAVYAHLQRGRNERFLFNPKDSGWYLRDPKNGVNTVDDLDGAGE